MKLQRLYSYVRRAIDDYQMIEAGDKIAVGISGGKDSLTLLYALAGLRHFYPKPFELIAITVDLGYEGFDLSSITALCAQLDVEYHIVKTEIGSIVTASEQVKSPCALCARMRKGALNEMAVALGCNKIAYAHHMDDMIETMMMSLLYEGQFYVFPPVTHLTRTELTVIRPMMYVPESDVIGFHHKYTLPLQKNPCPYDGHTKREYIKQLIRRLQKENPGAKQRMFTAILNGHIPDWPNQNE